MSKRYKGMFFEQSDIIVLYTDIEESVSCILCGIGIDGVMILNWQIRVG